MDKVRRILVHVCRDGATPQKVHFVQSVTGLLGDGVEDQVEVSCSLDRNMFVLHRDERGPRTPLKRPSFCPIKHLPASEVQTIPLDVLQRGVDVGVAVLLQTANQRVLLTRRAKTLRIFPNVWVPPGGHLESDETLLEAGLRELKEETGLELDQNHVCPQILGMWESVFPPFLSRGSPHRHHVVVYMLLHSPLSHLQLQPMLTPSPSEVSACLWADVLLVSAIVCDVDGEDKLPPSISVSEVSADGVLTDASLPPSVFTSRAPAEGPDVERVSTGTKFALQMWLRSLDKK
uniref:m7GpppN-mRNA hydrolase NUDT17 n=1 Tax=Gouania willdenowi TaxID=441366 RepID=A0A8C5DQH8_GOUWI